MTKSERASRRAIAAKLRAQHRNHASRQPCELCLVLELLEEQEARLDDALEVLDELADVADAAYGLRGDHAKYVEGEVGERITAVVAKAQAELAR